jgi:asparagine synthase (glutamine-hydrolysing)
VPWHHFARASVEKSQLIVRSPYLDNDLVKLSFQAPDGYQKNFDLCLKLVADGDSRLARIPTDRGIRYGASRVLNCLSRSRQQFLLKGEYAYDYGMPNWLARVDRLLSPLNMQRLFLGRQKFCHFRTWYARQLKDYVKEILLDSRSRSRPYVNLKGIERVVSSHLAGTHNFTSEIHKLLSLELLHRLFLES